MLKGKSEHGTEEILNKAIQNIEQQMENGELKGSMGDLVRLLQLRNEVAGSQPQQVTVRWIDECQTAPANEE